MPDAIKDLVTMPNLPITKKLTEKTKTPMPGYVGVQELAPALEELRTEEEKAEKKVGEADVVIEQAKREEKANEATQRQQLLERLGKESKELPVRQELEKKRGELENLKFTPDQATANDLAKIFSLINVVGFVVGRGNALNAMAAMDGMAKGYQQGREDLYKKQATEFDKNFKAMQTSVSTLEKQLQEALELKKIDKEAGEQEIIASLAKAQSPFLKAVKDKQGDIALLNAVKSAKKDMQTLVTLQNDIQGKKDAKVAEERRLLQQETLARLQREATIGSQYKDVRGQMAGLVQNYGLTGNEVMGLGPKEIASVSSNLESAAITQSLANDIKKHPYAAGPVSSFISSLDKYIPSRYNDQDAALGVTILNQAANNLQDPSLSEDEISEVRKIAKKAVDVINARASAATGGGRILVSELNLQKGVIGLEGLSAKSAVDVYSNLAKQDIDKIKRFGITEQTTNNIKSRISGSPTQQAPTQSLSEEKLKAYADAYFKGDVAKAKDYLATQGY
jgi:hypothetical protein